MFLTAFYLGETQGQPKMRSERTADTRRYSADSGVWEM